MQKKYALVMSVISKSVIMQNVIMRNVRDVVCPTPVQKNGHINSFHCHNYSIN